jgi:hypothetical protein
MSWWLWALMSTCNLTLAAYGAACLWKLALAYYRDPMVSHLSIVADPREKITISLVGVEYVITPPKASAALKMAIQAKGGDDDPAEYLAALTGWAQKAFGKATADKVMKRLDDDEDDLDLQHLTQLMEGVAELTAGNPTSSS